MKRENELNKSNKQYFIKRSKTLKTMGSPLSKRGSHFTRKNSSISKFDKKAIQFNKIQNLEKANNKILNFITNCVEKIKDEKNEDAKINSYLEGVIEKQKLLKEHKNIKKKKFRLIKII